MVNNFFYIQVYINLSDHIVELYNIIQYVPLATITLRKQIKI